jgi:hypothetical protein
MKRKFKRIKIIGIVLRRNSLFSLISGATDRVLILINEHIGEWEMQNSAVFIFKTVLTFFPPAKSECWHFSYFVKVN